jgi:TonB-linked SusC/RagA family outer membrane protein
MEKRLMTMLVGLFLLVGGVLAQTKVTGTVVSQDDGQPVVGATVLVVGTSTGTVTDANGKFSLTVPAGKSMLRITYIGMEPLDVQARPNMRILLTSDSKALDEVIVVAYGTAKRSAFTGSATEIKATEISSHVTSTATNALVGKVAGVQAVSSSGAPGSAPTLTIRGIGSYAASSTPLYVIDGVPMAQGMATINPDDIESMSVLKDASASAIYGNRGANGVIIITTKKAKGAAQDAEVKFDAKWGSNSRLIPRYDLITDPAQYYETHYRAMYNSIAYNGGTAAEAYAFADANLFNQNNGGLGYQVFTVPEGEKLIGTNFKMNPHATLGYNDGTYTYLPDNWYDETIHSALRQEYTASVSGNTGRLSYYASGSYLNDGGQVEKSKFERYTARTNVEYQAKKWLKLTTNMAFTHRISQTPSYGSTYGSSGNMFYLANSIGAIYPLYVRDKDGNIMKESGRTVYDSNNTNFTRPSFVGNAVRDNAYNDYKSYADIFFGQWGATITPIEGLNISANINANSITSRYTYLYSRFASGSGTDGQVTVQGNRNFSVNQQYLANYTRKFGEHNISILAGYEQYKEKDQGLEASNTNLFDPFIAEINNAKGPAENKSISSSTDNYMTEGFLARATYDYSDRYFANASIRRDASSKFAPGHRWGTFWSIGGAWQINKETFMQDVKWVDLLKLKVSYGENGNDQGMDWHAYSDRFSTIYNKDTKQYSVTMTAKGNDELTWETKKSWNFGLDFSLFKYRLNGSIEFYTGTTSDLLWYKTVPLSSGLMVSDYPANIGSILNRGIEFSLDGTVIKTKDFQWDLNFNISHNHNEFTELDPTIAETGLRSSRDIIRVGGSRYEAYMVKFAGVDPENGRARYWKAYVYDPDPENMAKPESERALKATTNSYGDGEIVKEEMTYDITEATRYDLGSTLPKVMGGFGTNVRFKDFDLSAQFSYQLGGKFYDGAYQQLMHNGQETGHAMHKDLLNAWSPENPNSNIPRLSTAAIDDPGVASQTTYDRFLTSSNYLCLNNLTVGYTLPKSLIAPLTLRSVRVYFAGENLFLLTKRKGMDPRYNYGVGGMTSGGGLASGAYAAMRSLTGGITITF